MVIASIYYGLQEPFKKPGWSGNESENVQQI